MTRYRRADIPGATYFFTVVSIKAGCKRFLCALNKAVLLWTAYASEPISPIAVFEAGHHHLAGALARCMNKIITTDINTDMGEWLAVGVKENQVAGMKVIFRDLCQ